MVGSHLIVRTGSLLLALLLTTAVAARISDVAVAAHQIAFQIWTFLALALDAIAIAGQAMVGKFLGADDETGAKAASRADARVRPRRGPGLGTLTALLRPVLVPLFTDSPAVTALAEQVLWFVAALQPVAALVFVLDGILIGAGDSRYLAIAMVGAMLVYLPAVGVVVALDGGLLMLWAAFSLCGDHAARRHRRPLPHRSMAGDRGSARLTSPPVASRPLTRSKRSAGGDPRKR